MKFAVLLVPNFSLLALLRNERALFNRPVALIVGEGRKAVVGETTPESESVVGLAVPLATARCPGLLFKERDPAAEAEAQKVLLASAFALSPRVESTGPGCCTVDLQGADEAWTETEMGRQVAALKALNLSVRIGAGDTPILALYAARRATSVLLVKERVAFLRVLPLAFAEPTAQQAAVLKGWGISTLGGLTELPKAEIGNRLGPDGAALWDRANGESPPVLRLTQPAWTFEAEWIYEPPVESSEPLLFKLRRFAERVALELRTSGLAAEALSLTLNLEDETDYQQKFRLREPCTDVELWLRVFQTHFDQLRLKERVAGVRLFAFPARPEIRQDGLFDTGLTDASSFWENLARLSALVGEDRVGTPAHADSHAPDAFTMDRPAATVPAPEPLPIHPSRSGVLRRFRPALPARVLCSGSLPVAIEGTVRGEVRGCAGPTILRGEWWKPGSWSVETWQVELIGGGLYQLSRNVEGWWIDGVLN